MGFECYHPAISLGWFGAVVGMTALFGHPVFLAVSWASAFAYSLRRCGRKALRLNTALLLLSVVFALGYAGLHHFGITVLWRNFIGNSITAEALVCGLDLAMRGAAVVMWLECLFSVFTADKVVYLFGCVSPKLSLWLSVLLRLIPRVAAQAGKQAAARRGIGLGTGQGTLFQRLRHGMAIGSALVTWLLDYLSAVSDTMRCRGLGLKGRTAFSLYRFDNRDRILVIGLFFCLTAVLAGQLLGQTEIRFAPSILIHPVTPLSAVFYGSYAVLCLIPLLLEYIQQWRFSGQLSAVMPRTEY